MEEKSVFQRRYLGARLLTIGTFDTPHIGHAIFLRKCEALAEQVIVGVNTDSFVQKFKGELPVFNTNERIDAIRALDKSYWVTYNGVDSGLYLIDAYKPDIISVGSDWYEKDYWTQIGVSRDFFTKRGITLVFLPYTQGISTSSLKERLHGKART